jgi:hypothetical protein
LNKKQHVFQPLINFFSAGVLIIVSPVRFLRDFEFLKGSWKTALWFGLAYKFLTSLITILSLKAFLVSPLMETFQGISFGDDEFYQTQIWESLTEWFHVPSIYSLLSVPLTHIPSVLFWAAIIWAVARFSRGRVPFKYCFNMISSFAPFTFLYALMIAIIVMFLNSFQAVVILGGIFLFVFMISLYFLTRTFHYELLELFSDSIVKDSGIVFRFYVILTLLFAIPCIGVFGLSLLML